METFNEKTRKIYEALPKMNCGLCGFESCFKYAAAVAEGKASPFGCRRDLEVGYTLSRVMESPESGGINSGSELAVSTSKSNLKEDVHKLSTKVDDILSRIERLANKRSVIRE